jgi:hypothetical protein
MSGNPNKPEALATERSESHGLKKIEEDNDGIIFSRLIA